MGRPDPCVLFSQTFVHPNLDEYVDEVLFAEPIVITACEFLEQNASSTSQSVNLVGATLPPSFALEVFVHCEGEARFKRLCQPFLYSHSSSNVLEVEAVVTNHLVVRGSYRSLTLVIYGNTAEDLGQFNIEFDDNSITNLVSSAEGKLEDLPLPLRSNNLKLDESISNLKVLSVPLPLPDISIEAKLFLLLLSKTWELPIIGDALDRFFSIVVSAATSYITQSWGKFNNYQELQCIIRDIRREVFLLYQQELGNASTENLADSLLQSEVKIVSSKKLVSMLSHFFCFKRESLVGYHQISQRTYINLGLSVALLLCSGRESCFHFVSGGGMEQIVHVFSLEVHNSTPTMLLLLGVVEQATRHSFGCERFLGWWAREGESVPSGISEGYSSLLNLLLQKPRHDVFSSATYILHRLRLFELAARYESAVLSVLRDFSTDGTGVTLDMLITIKSLLKKLLKLIKSHGTIEDPSPMGCATRSLSVRQTESMLSYKGSSSLISSYDCGFSNTDIDLHLLTLLKERGFLPLSVALLSSTKLRSEVGHPVEIFLDIASYIETIILSLLFCRSGLIFLLQQPELYTTVMHALIVGDDLNKEICVPLRYAFVLITKGFFCDPGEVGMVIGMHLRVVYAIDRLLTIAPQSEEFLWVLWELCALARSHCGRQALLSLAHFPEAVTILIEALHSAKEPEPVAKANGALPLNLAIFYSAAELFEVIVSDSTASSLCSWIGCVMELHRALHSSSPGSHRKDAPTRLLDWIDAGIVYHKNGAIGLLRYAAVLASGGDAHLSSTTAVVSDLTDVENIIGDASSGSDFNVMDNLCKFISDKSFDGVSLRDSSLAQLTTAFRILAFISENSAVAAALYDEGAITVIYTILVNSRVMLERSSNNYDYLVDEGTETNSTSDLLLERDREQSLIDLLVPSLMLLINLLLKLKESEEQHRNTKLMNALIRLHREASPKLAASAADLSSSYPESALGFGSICHLVASALAFWPVYGWTPGLFNSLLASVQSTPLLALGPKETCSLLCVLNDLLPEEGVWLWKNGMPLLSALRTLSVGTLLGLQKEEKVNWYRQPTHLEKLLGQLAPHLDKIAQIIQHYAISELVVIQDMLRVFVMRIAYQKSEYGSVLLRPILSWIRDIVCDASYPLETDIYKVYKCLDFLASLLEHPHAKALLLKEGFIRLLTRVLKRCLVAIDSDDKQILDSRNSSKSGLTILSWGLPIFKSCTVLFDSQTSTRGIKGHDLHAVENLSAEHRVMILAYILRFCQVLPIGKELLACLVAFKEIGSQEEGQSSLAAIFKQIHSSVEEPGAHRGNERDGCGVYQILNEFEWKKQPPLLICLKKLLTSVDSKESLSAYSIQALNTLCLGSLYFCMDKESLHLDRLATMKFFFAVADEMDTDTTYDAPEENPNNMLKLLTSLSSKIAIDNPAANHDAQTALSQVVDSAKSLLLLLKSDDLVKVEDLFTTSAVPLSPVDLLVSPKIHQLSDGNSERSEDFFYIGFGDKFLWECPETLPDRFSQNPGKRKMPSVEGPNRRARAETSPADITAQNTFSRVLGSSTTPGPTRRDTFRQRKPNTSRPPSMHVDDYVARERNVDGINNSNVIAVQRVGSASGRPPSIHVDEFMARQRERQNPMAAVIGDVTPQVKSAAHVNETVAEKASKPEQVKADLDDELQGIDIVFDGEESESDDKLPFLQPDDNLQQHAPVIVEQNSPHSIVEETESDVHGSSQFSHFDTPIASNFDENTQSEFSSRMSISLPEIPLTRESSVSSDKKYFEQVDDHKSVMNIKASGGFVSGVGVGNTCFPGSVYSNLSALPVQLPVDARMTPQKFYVKNSPPAGNATVAMGSQGLYDQRFPNQPPLPPMPPPLTVPPLISQTSDAGPSHSSPFMNSIADVHQPLAPSFQVHSDYLSTFSNSSSLLGSSLPMQEYKYSRTSISSPSGSARHHPPLPPTPPPFSSSPYNLTSNRTATQSSVYNQAMELPQSSTAPPPDSRLGGLSSSGSRANDYSPSLQPQSVYSRSGSIPVSLYRNIPMQQQGENTASILQNLSNPQSTVPSVHSLTQLQPLQPPQLPLPPQPPQHLRPPIQASQQIDHGMPLQNNLQMPLHSLQIPQQPQISPVHTFHNSSHQHVQPQAINPPCDLATLQHQDPGMSLHEYFKSPEAIQSLLSDRDKLCQLLEQHPKLMQLLQEKLCQQ